MAEAEWRIIPDDGGGAIIHHNANIIASWVGYFMFGLILYTCKNRRYVFSERMPDVLLILTFAFLTDLSKMRMHVFFLVNQPHFIRHNNYFVLPTTVAACTMGMWVIYSQFLITYVEAIIALYRFVVRYRPKPLSTSYIYIGVGIAVTLHIWLFFDTFLEGTAESMGNMEIPMYCSKALMLKVPALVSKAATTYVLAIAPIVSMITSFKKSKIRDQGVTAFIFISSSAMAGLVYVFLLFDHVPAFFQEYAKLFLLGVYLFQDFRFPLMCLLAVTFVHDIRAAVFATLSDSIRKLDWRKKSHESFTNEAFLE